MTVPGTGPGTVKTPAPASSGSSTRHPLFTPPARRFMRGWLALAVAMALLPLALRSGYQFTVLNVVAVNLIVVTGLNLLMGYAGQISYGHAAFFGMGAYGSAILSTTHGVDPWLAMGVSACGVAVAAAAVGVPTLRLKGNYLVMATLGFNLIVDVILVQWSDVTGGSSGFVGVPPLSVAGISFDTDRSFYWLAWGVALLLLIPARNLVHSPVGRALRAIHDSEPGAEACGVPTASYKVQVFVLSAVFASLAGSLHAHYLGIVAPKTFDIFKSVEFVTMCLIGGMGSLWGGLAGALLLTVLPQMLGVFEEHHDLIFGAILLVMLIFMPRGVSPWLRDLLKKGWGGGKRPGVSRDSRDSRDRGDGEVRP